ncbi:MAG TPA: hypothetical protein VHA54_11325 [Solirubrobacterales bacterium]|nr:hypothetical protein [Solirubrobacterales bacterium]
MDRGRRIPAAAAIGALAVATTLSLLRLGWSVSLHTVWAEDGPIFLQRALTDGFWHAVFTPYAGYLVVVPRLIAELATLVPLRDAPTAIAIVAALLAALSGLVVWVASADLVRSPYLRFGLAAALAFSAVAGQETLDSAAYVGWFMLAAAFWLLFWRPRTVAGAAAGGLFLLATGLSTPGVWFFAPAAVLRGIRARDRRDGLLLAGYAAGALAQVPVVLSQPQNESLWTSKIWTAYLQRVVDGGIFGQRLGGNLWAHLGWPFLVVLVAAVAVGFWFGLRRSTPSARLFAALALPISLVMFLVSVYQRTVGEEIAWAAGASGGTGSRYAVVPALLLLSAAVVTLDGALRRRGQTRGLPRPAAAALALLALAIVTSFDMSSAARDRPRWEDALRTAATRCVSRNEELAGIPTSPRPFGVVVPCAAVASFSAPVRGRR